MIALDADTKCVNGRNCEKLCNHSGALSRENHNSERRSIGKLIRLRRPFARSSLEVLAAINNDILIMERFPNIATKSKSR
jgi:hypothetical protein